MINNEVIKDIIAKNDYLPRVDYSSQKFSEEYGLSALEIKKKDKELLLFMFGLKGQNNKSLTYRLENDRKITDYFGKARPGYSQGRILNYSKDSWRCKAKSIPENEAIDLAYKICIGIIKTLKQISINSNAVEIHQLLIENDVPADETWIKKYFTILYPDKFMSMLNHDWTNRIFYPIGLNPVDDWYENSKTFCDKAREFGLDGVKFFHAIAKAIISEVKKELSERGVDTTCIKEEMVLTVNSLAAWNEEKKHIPDDDIRSEIEAYFREKYSWIEDKAKGRSKRKTDNSKKSDPVFTLLNEIIEALKDLGGTASLEELYRKIEERDNIPSIHTVKTWRDSVRSTIYTHSTDSNTYREGYEDLFESVGGIRSGKWKLREENVFDKSYWKKWGEKRNLIVFGAPGTGKSYKLNLMKNKLIDENNDDQFERVTFHPEYSYASFVGVYKPTPVSDDKNKNSITYQFVPGPFMRMYVKAKQNPEKPYIILIEEINRSNTAAVFGDIFQLLDRDSNYESEYEIAASRDIQDFLNDKDKTNSFDDNSHSIIKIPGNLFIWATMNSADQGVFPMDSAFKRRWNFEYVDVDDGYESPIADGSPYTVKNSKFKISINGKEEEIYWNDLRCEINNQLVSKLNVNEDKLLGAFFIKVNESDGSVSLDDIKYKVLMYLFDDVARHRRTVIFRNTTSRFSEIIAEFEKKGLQVFNDDVCDKYRKIHPEPSGED